jgi:hypothetical protein
MAFAKSQKISPTINLSFRALTISLINSQFAFSFVSQINLAAATIQLLF